MIRGETVVVRFPVEGAEDAHGNPVESWVEEPVEDVLVAPGPRADIPDTSRPDGVRVVFNLHFPKSFTRGLRGARISVRGSEPLKVVGDPAPYTLENTPTRWWMPVEVARADG